MAMKKFSAFFSLLFLLSAPPLWAQESYCDDNGKCWYKSQDGQYLYDNKGHYLYPQDSSAASQGILADLGAVPAGAHPKTILAGDENQQPGYYQTDALSNVNREIKKLPAQKEPTIEEKILAKIAKGEPLTAGEKKIYDEVIRPTAADKK